MPIYTGRGDEGLTDLRGAVRVSKADARIEAYGTVDELNAVLGTVVPTGHDDVDGHLREVQNHLHVVQAEFATPDPDDDGDPSIRETHVKQLEDWIDAFEADLDPLRAFILPGGSDSGAALHHARTVCRRAERRAIDLASAEPVPKPPLVYLNRLSDALFVFARLVNKRDGVREDHPTY